MNFIETFQALGSNAILFGGTFILVLSILVFVHEWGHYIIARLCGVKVETFSIGFGKELFGFNDKHGTRWKFSMIPLGGFVKMYGDMDPASAGHNDEVKDGEEVRPMSEEERSEAFFAKPVWKRAAVVFAGPAINYIFAIILLTGLFTMNGQPVTPPKAAAVIGGSAAEKYGFKPHDRIISIDGVEITSFEDIRREMMVALDTDKQFVVERDGTIMEFLARPNKVSQEDRFGFKHSRGLLGLISPRNAVKIDTIVQINGLPVKGEDTIRQALSSRFGQTFEIGVTRGDEIQIMRVNPKAEYNEHFSDPESQKYDILLLSDIEANQFIKRPVGIAFLKSIEETWNITRGTLEALGQIVTGARSAKELGGVIRIGALAGDMAQQGIIALIMFTALLSINLGLINLLPIPMLDGGHLVFYAFEAARGKPVPEQMQEYAFRIGFAFLIGIMVFANLNDILQLVLKA